MTFFEYIARQPGISLPDGETLLRMIGVSPTGPHEIDVMRMVKQWKKQAPTTAMAPSRYAFPSPRRSSRSPQQVRSTGTVVNPANPSGDQRCP